MFTRTTLTAVVAALALPAAAFAQLTPANATATAGAARSAAAIWAFEHPDGDGGTYVALTGRDETRAGTAGGPAGRRGVQPAIFEVSCDAESDELVFASFSAVDPLAGTFEADMALSRAEASGTATLQGTATRIPGCDAPDWGAAQNEDLGTFQATMTASFAATAPPLAFPAAGADPSDPTRCLMGGFEAMASRTAAASGTFAGNLPLAYTPPADLGGPAHDAQVMLVAAGSAAIPVTGECFTW